MTSNTNPEIAVIKNDVKWIKDRVEETIRQSKSNELRINLLEKQMSRMIGYAAGAGVIGALVKDLLPTIIS